MIILVFDWIRGGSILKIGIIGVVAAILSSFIRKDRMELSVVLGMVAGMIIFYFVLTQISVVLNFISEMIDMVEIEERIAHFVAIVTALAQGNVLPDR